MSLSAYHLENQELLYSINGTLPTLPGLYIFKNMHDTLHLVEIFYDEEYKELWANHGSYCRPLSESVGKWLKVI